MKAILALRKMGFNGEEIAAMPEAQAVAYLDAYGEIVNPGSGTTYRVKRNAGKGRSRRGHR